MYLSVYFFYYLSLIFFGLRLKIKRIFILMDATKEGRTVQILQVDVNYMRTNTEITSVMVANSYFPISLQTPICNI